MNDVVATGFDFEPLPDGNVLIEFYADGGKTFNRQVISAQCMAAMPEVSELTVQWIKQHGCPQRRNVSQAERDEANQRMRSLIQGGAHE